MAMNSETLLLCIVLLVGVFGRAVYAQTLVDISECQTLRLPCGTKEAGNFRAYCCIEQNGPFLLHNCCNPYISLGIGLSVGIPLLAAIIIGLIVGYSWCSRYHNRKMNNLMIAYRQAQLEEDEEEIEGNNECDNPAAPPAYTPVAKAEQDNPDTNLPVYSENDPFASSSTNEGAAVISVEVQDTIPLIEQDPTETHTNETETV